MSRQSQHKHKLNDSKDNNNKKKNVVVYLFELVEPIPWGHNGPLCHALSLLSSLSLSLTSMRRRRATVAAGDSSDTW